MIEVKVTDEMVAVATKKAEALGKLKKSITGGEGNVAGFIGEIVTAEYFPKGEIVSDDSKDYDFILDGVTYDIKTKRCTSEPKNTYAVSVAAANVVQKCDRYLFVRVEHVKGEPTNWTGRAWLLGWLAKDVYYAAAKKLKKGQRDGDNWFTVKADCYNLDIKFLTGVDEIETNNS